MQRQLDFLIDLSVSIVWIMRDNIASGTTFPVSVISCYYLFPKYIFSLKQQTETLKQDAKGQLCSLPCAQHCLHHFMSLAVMVTSPQWYFFIFSFAFQ